MPAPSLRALEDALGHVFNDPDLLRSALTHGSVESRPSNQRLEFLGDRVLGLVIAALLYRQHPGDPEGALSARFHALVCKEALGAIARDCGVGPLLHLSRTEAEHGGRDKTAILADAMEAIIAATYLDGGHDAAQGMVERLWQPYLSGVTKAPKAVKSALQERTAALKLGHPVYETVAQAGPAHAPVFTVSVSVGDDRRAEGTGATKRMAEIEAATRMLALLEGEG